MKTKSLLSLVLLAALTVGCSGAISTPTATPTSVPTATPTRRPTATPTATPVPTATPIPVPGVTSDVEVKGLSLHLVQIYTVKSFPWSDGQFKTSAKGMQFLVVGAEVTQGSSEDVIKKWSRNPSSVTLKTKKGKVYGWSYSSAESPWIQWVFKVPENLNEFTVFHLPSVDIDISTMPVVHYDY